jgi:hypothetical protein
MRIVTKKVANNYKRCKHKRCKTQTTKIMIMMTMKVTNNYSQEGRKGKHEDYD